MKVILLAGTAGEARQYARDADLRPVDTVVAGSLRSVAGVRVEDGDLIVQFPTFRQNRQCDVITNALLDSINTVGAKPRWVRPGQK